MAQTTQGAEKVSAAKAGLTVEEFRAKRAAGLKRCIACKDWKAVDQFNADRSRHDGFAARCRRCCQRTDGPSKTERRRQRAVGLEWCRGCKNWVPDALVPRTDGACRPCLNAARRTRYANDASFRYRLKQHAYTRKRSVDAVPPEGEKFLLELFGGQCAYCESAADTWDHILAVKKRGRTTPGNIVPACKSCNSSKGDQDVWDWMQSRGITPSELLIDKIAFMEASLYG